MRWRSCSALHSWADCPTGLVAGLFCSSASCTFLGFLLLGFARALWVLFVARIIDGLTGGNLSVAQAYITDVSNKKNRGKALGLIGAAFGLGFIIGPAVGGLWIVRCAGLSARGCIATRSRR